MERSYKGMKKYESIIQLICNAYNFDSLPENEWEGCIGVAIVMSVLDGVPPRRKEISDHLKIPAWNQNYNAAFDRLKINGILSSQYNIKDDQVLKGRSKATPFRTSTDIEMNAWCLIAGVAGGFTGIREVNIG